MPVHNSEIADIFNEVADLLDISGANRFRVRAYRDAARTIGGLGRSVADMLDQGEDLIDLPGIGKDLAGKIQEIVKTGALEQLKELRKEQPSELSGLMKISGLGPKRVHALHQNLGVTDAASLKKAAEEKKVRHVEGFGEKTEANILEVLKSWKVEGGKKKRTKLAVVVEIADSLAAYLKDVNGVKEVAVAGSYRRRKETVGDLDILVTHKKGADVITHFVDYDEVSKVISKGKTKSSVVLRSGLQVDLRAVAQVSYGAALHYFTGSKAHNIAIRKLGGERNLKINEYGVFKGEKRVAGKTEEEVYATVDLPYIEPELRENAGEIEAAQKNALPHLVDLSDIRGDLHAHTKETDGHHTLEEMAKAAQDKGYDYIGITDHSKRVSMAHGLDAKRLARRNDAIDRMNEGYKGFQILKGIEVDILKDGSLDLPDEILRELDYTVCSVHYNTNLSREKQTKRIIRAMDNPYFHIFGHPSGRLINERQPYDVDLEAVLKAAKERGCFVELNAHPDRLDLTDAYCRTAKEMGVKVAISTDAHSTVDLDFMRFGIYQGRRGWLEPDDVINTRSRTKLIKLFKRA